MSDRPDDPTTPLSRDATTPLSQSPPHESFPHRYAPNDVLAGRYRIVRVAGMGGMGIVYEAEDLELGERVALKTLHAPLQAQEREIARLRREVQLARRVTHPNVCRIYDAGRHEEVLFVTMELLDGETLSHHIAAKGRLGIGEATAILRQLCAGLQAAHDAGVIHRDFKSGNVMLVPRGNEMRAVITDFGLARTTEIDAQASHRSAIIGTPAYMAPEQIRGDDLTPAADVYALGVVAFEMVAGAVPFADASVPSLVRRLTEPAPTPRRFVSDIDERFEAIVVRCLETDPRDRFATPDEVVQALGDGVPIRRKTPRRWIWIAAAAVTVLAISLLLLWSSGRFGRPSSPGSNTTPQVAKTRRSVAVLGFRNLSQREEAAWLSTALAEMLATELAAAESLRVIPGEEIARAKRDLELADADSHAPRTLARLRGATGADFVVLGSYVALPDTTLRLDLRVQRTTGGDTIASFMTTGAESDLFTLVATAGATLRDRLGADARLAEGLDLRRAVPLNTAAAKHFAVGVTRMRAYEAVGARDALEKAVAADPQFALAYAELADAYALLGFDAKASQAARKALELSGRLPRADRLMVEAKYQLYANRHAEAIALFQTLVKTFPDDPEPRLRLIDAYIDNSRGNEATAAIAEMRKLRGTFDIDARIDLLDAWAAEVLSDIRRILASADRAIAKARPVQNRDVLAEALVMRAWALANTGKLDQSLAAFDEAEELFTAIGNRAGVAKSLRKRSYIFWRRGELAEARRLNERALRIYREVGQQQGTAGTVGSIGVILNTLGDHSGARDHFHQALEIYHRIGDRQNVAWAISSIAGTLVMQNALDAGRRGYEESLALSREIGDVNQIAVTLVNLGEIHSRAGELAEVEQRIAEASAMFKKLADRSSLAYCDSIRGEVAFARGDLKAARTLQQRALTARRELGETGTLTDNQLALALIEFEEGNPAGALGQAAAAASEFEAEKRLAGSAAALVLVARANHTLGRRDDALAAIARAEALLPDVQDPRVEAVVKLEKAVIGNDAEALEALAARGVKERMPALHFDARLALIELDVRTGRHDRARTRAAELARDAKGRGYGLVERKARKAM